MGSSAGVSVVSVTLVLVVTLSLVVTLPLAVTTVLAVTVSVVMLVIVLSVVVVTGALGIGAAMTGVGTSRMSTPVLNARTYSVLNHTGTLSLHCTTT